MAEIADSTMSTSGPTVTTISRQGEPAGRSGARSTALGDLSEFAQRKAVTVRVVDAITGTGIGDEVSWRDALTVAISPNGSSLALGGHDGKVFFGSWGCHRARRSFVGTVDG